MPPLNTVGNQIRVLSKAETLDVVVEAFTKPDGTIIRQLSFTKEQLEVSKAQAKKMYDTQIARFDELLAILNS
jgi:hypothetical protein